MASTTKEDLRLRLVNQLAKYAYQWSQTPSFPLSSGQLSDEYLDCKSALSIPETMATVGPVVLTMLDASVAAVGGLTMGADPIAMSTCQSSAQAVRPVRWFCVRKEGKEHGLKKIIEGSVKPGDKVAVVDDVVTTGGSTVKAIEACRRYGLEVVQVIVLVDRQQSNGMDTIRNVANCPVTAICTKSEVADEWHRLNPSALRATA